MKSNIEIFDKDGKALDIAVVISRFIKENANKHNLKDAEIALYFEEDTFEVGKIDTDNYAYQFTLEDCKINGL